MRLEEIAKQYGMVDYLDQHTGYIYQLSKAINNGDGTLSVPVIDSCSSCNALIGYAHMNKVI